MHAPPLPETLAMMGPDQFEAMRDGAVYVNTARAALHDLDALTAALSTGKLAAAALDHFEGEQLPADHPLTRMDNVVLTPHIGGATYDTEVNHSDILAEDIERLLARRGTVALREPGGSLMPEIDEVRAAVLAAAKELHARGLVSGTAGNVSGKIDDGRYVLTPSSVPYVGMTLEDLVVVDIEGTVLEGHRSPTSEVALHLECYRNYPEVGGVVHCHARYSSMFAVAHRAIPAGIDEFVIYIGGDVPCAEYRQSGSGELAREVAGHLAHRSAALMANHGLLCVGRSVEDALHSAEVVEHNAQIMWGAEALGGVQPLPERAVEDFTAVYQFVRGEMWGN